MLPLPQNKKNLQKKQENIFEEQTKHFEELERQSDIPLEGQEQQSENFRKDNQTHHLDFSRVTF